MEKFKYILMTLCGMLITTAFTACGDDDDEGSSSPIVGSWVHTEQESGSNYTWKSTDIWVFNSNGSGYYTSVGSHIFPSEPSMSSTWNVKNEFTYSLAEPSATVGVIVLNMKAATGTGASLAGYEAGVFTKPYTIANNTLSLWGDNYTRN